jgi:hypothetical protein
VSRFHPGQKVVIAGSITTRHRGRVATVINVRPSTRTRPGVTSLDKYAVRFDDGIKRRFMTINLCQSLKQGEKELEWLAVSVQVSSRDYNKPKAGLPIGPADDFSNSFQRMPPQRGPQYVRFLSKRACGIYRNTHHQANTCPSFCAKVLLDSGMGYASALQTGSHHRHLLTRMASRFSKPAPTSQAYLYACGTRPEFPDTRPHVAEGLLRMAQPEGRVESCLFACR